jgi:subfamily B ATP-binding cassette protein MsbA
MTDRTGNTRRLLGYVAPHWTSFAAATACGLVKFLAPVAMAWLVGKAVNVLTAEQAGTLDAARAWEEIRRLVMLGAAIAALTPIPTYLRNTFSYRATHRVVERLRCDVFAHLQRLSHSFFDANRSGALTSRLLADTETIVPFLNKVFVQAWMCLGMIAIVLGYFFSQSVRLGLLSLCLLPLQLAVQHAIGGRVRETAARARDEMAALSGDVQERLAAPAVVKSFGRERHEVDRFARRAEALFDVALRHARLGGVSEAVIYTLTLVGQLLVILLGGFLALSPGGGLSAGLLIQFVLMQNQLYSRLEFLVDMQLVAATALGATDRIFAMLDTEPEMRDRPGATDAPRFAGEIRFEDVVFSYPRAARRALDGLTVHAPARSTLALVGPSGGGKSTTIALLLRFYEWTSGRILVDGRDIREYTIASLRRQIGLVPQEPILFSGTIAENIRYGRLDATPEEVREAARQAYADEFIEKLERGYETVVGERGATLSGGQKQRIAIARVFLKDPAILLLDEATSALDSASERIVQDALERLMRDRTTLVVAHRLSTVRNAREIAVIEGGRVVESGDHEALLGRGALYAKLWRHQIERPDEASPARHRPELPELAGEGAALLLPAAPSPPARTDEPELTAETPG